MVRKGSVKVRTGCFTCKVRKVKCDETKPECMRCTHTGRTCEGYPAPRPGVYSWDELLRKPALLTAPSGPSAGDCETLRLLDYFRSSVAPQLSGYFDRYFWTTLVSQVGFREPAIRHALVAISSTFEGMSSHTLDRLQQGKLPHSQRLGPAEKQGAVALRHGSRALAALRAGSPREDVMLLVSILFTCLMVMQDKMPEAIFHCLHGVRILNGATGTNTVGSRWARAHLLPIFLRLCISPFLFGPGLDGFPALADLAPAVCLPFASVHDVRFVLDSLVIQAVRFVKRFDPNGLGDARYDPVPPETRHEQRAIVDAMEWWLVGYDQLAPSVCVPGDPSIWPVMLMRCLVIKIWLSTCLDTRGVSELAYDEHIPAFRRVVDCAEYVRELYGAMMSGPSPPGSFELDAAFVPLLFFVVINCRDLRIRLAALGALLTLAADKEHVWDSRVMGSVGRRLIEREHGLDLAAITQEQFEEASRILPADPARVRDSCMVKGERREEEDGETVTYKRVRYMMSDGTRDMVPDEEWVPVRAAPQAVMALSLG